MSASTFLYFAYGSNMLSARLQAPERCPSARPVGVASLPGYELRWHKRSKKDGSAKCDIVQTGRTGAELFGVVYEIAAGEKGSLDSAEGLGYGYAEAELWVYRGANQLAVKAYIATNTDPTLKPYTWYRALVVAGAKEHGLPADYVAGLEATPADQDSNKARHNENMALIDEVQP